MPLAHPKAYLKAIGKVRGLPLAIAVHGMRFFAVAALAEVLAQVHEGRGLREVDTRLRVSHVEMPTRR
jgi:hypothetical protein